MSDLDNLEDVDFIKLWELCDFEELWAFCKEYKPKIAVMPVSLFYYMIDNAIYSTQVYRDNAYQEAVSEYCKHRKTANCLIISYGFLVFRKTGFLSD